MAKIIGIKEFKAKGQSVDVKLLVGDTIVSMIIDLKKHSQLAKNINALAAMIIDVAQKILEE